MATCQQKGKLERNDGFLTFFSFYAAYSQGLISRCATPRHFHKTPFSLSPPCMLALNRITELSGLSVLLWKYWSGSRSVQLFGLVCQALVFAFRLSQLPRFGFAILSNYKS